MTTCKSWPELEKMHRACSIVVETLSTLEEAAAPGITTKEMDRIAAECLARAGAKPAFLGYRGYPATLCISVNEEVVHGIPGQRRLAEGDIVSVDLGCVVDGFFGDSAKTVCVGRVSAEAASLVETTRQCLDAAIAVSLAGKRVGDIGAAVQTLAESRGYSVVREFMGHGIGAALHEDPQIPNFGLAGRGKRLVPGMCLAIEPMVNAGGPDVRTLGDEWTVVTRDGSLSAHVELTVAVTEQGPWILSDPWPYARGEEAVRG